MITKNSVVKIQNLVLNHKSRPVKSNPVQLDIHGINKFIHSFQVGYGHACLDMPKVIPNSVCQLHLENELMSSTVKFFLQVKTELSYLIGKNFISNNFHWH